MSRLLHVQISNNNNSQQRHLKPTSPGSGGDQPVSPVTSVGGGGGLSPLSNSSMAASSPQGMPIPSRREPQYWMMSGGGGGWPGMMMDSAMESEESTEIDPMGGELSKLSMAVDEVDDDDIFRVERGDELLGPTLAELNAPDADTLLDGLNFDDLYWPADGQLPPLEATPSPQTPAGVNPLDPDGDLVPFQVHTSSSFPPLATQKGVHQVNIPSAPPGGSTLLEQTLLQQQQAQQQNQGAQDIKFTVSPTANPQPSTSGGLRELLLRRELQNSLESPDGASPLGQSLPRSSLSPTPGSFSQRLSTSAPTAQGNNAWEAWQQRRETVWSRRDPRPHLLSTGSLAEAGSLGSLSADVLSPGKEFSLSMDEGFDSDDVSDRDSSDEGESEVSDTESNAGSSSGTRRERFFWQYNVQAKGPKGQRLVLAPTQEDPHVLHKPTDPVFSPLCHIQGIKHSGKARKGDGNDLTPNPRKLWVIGKELDRLNKVIAEMTPVADLPNAVKSRSRKEKNKLASRACRLKKKAQHEANKLKLYGLEQEHRRLMNAIEQSKQLVFAKMDGTSTDPEPVLTKVERISKYGTKHKIGGHTTEFVNKVLEKVKAGVPDGGISEL